MLAARLIGPDGKDVIMIVLEPGNIEKLKQGQPIHKFLNEFMHELQTSVELMFCYSPDVNWVVEQLNDSIDSKDASRLAEILEQSLSRPEVLVRGKSAEEMKRTI